MGALGGPVEHEDPLAAQVVGLVAAPLGDGPLLATSTLVPGRTLRTVNVWTMSQRAGSVSYLTFEGKAPDPAKDVELHDQLEANGHWSPFEHAARQVRQHRSRAGRSGIAARGAVGPDEDLQAVASGEDCGSSAA